MDVKIQGMRKFSTDSQFQATSLPEIRAGVDEIAYVLRKQKVGKRTISEGHVANAAMLVLMAMPKDERYRKVLEAFEKMRALLEIDDPEERSDDIQAIIRGTWAQKTPTKDAGDAGPSVEAYDIEEQPDRPSKSGKKPKKRA